MKTNKIISIVIIAAAVYFGWKHFNKPKDSKSTNDGYEGLFGKKKSKDANVQDPALAQQINEIRKDISKNTRDIQHLMGK